MLFASPNNSCKSINIFWYKWVEPTNFGLDWMQSGVVVLGHKPTKMGPEPLSVKTRRRERCSGRKFYATSVFERPVCPRQGAARVSMVSGQLEGGIGVWPNAPTIHQACGLLRGQWSDASELRTQAVMRFWLRQKGKQPQTSSGSPEVQLFRKPSLVQGDRDECDCGILVHGP